MAPLTWREVSAPNFSGVAESQRLAGQMLSNGFQSSIDALGRLNDSQKAAANGEFLSRISGFTDAPAFRNALQNGTIFDGLDRSAITPETFDRANAHAAALLKDVQTGVVTDGQRLNNQNQSLQNDQLAWNNDKTRSFEAGRPAAVDLVNQIKNYAALGTPEGRAKAEELTRGGSKVLADSGFTTDMMTQLVNGNLDTTTKGIRTNTDLRDQGDAVRAHEIQMSAQTLYNEALRSTGNDVALAERMIRESSQLNPQVAQQALALLGSDQAKLLQGPDTNAASYMLQQTVDARTGGPSRGLIGLIDRTEGNGDYRTLFGHSQRPGGAFEGVDITQMTLAQLDDFDKEYGSWVNGEIGRVTTPGGRFQIVGTTRRQVADEMGLPSDTVFSKEVQDAMFYHLVDKRISGPRSMEAKMRGLRQEWEGFKNVSDKDLSAAITAYQNGDAGALGGITGAVSGQTNGPALSEGQKLFESALNSSSKLNQAQNQALFQGTVEVANQAASVMDAMRVDSIWGTTALAESLLDESLATESQTASLAKLRSAMGPDVDLKDPELTDNINAIKDKYGMSFGQAATVVANSLHQEPWILRWLQGQTNVDYNRFDELVGQVYNKDGKTRGDKFRPAMELLENSRSKQNAATQLTNMQGMVDQAQQRYVNLLARVRTNATPALERELQRAQLEYQTLLGQMKKTVSTIDSDPRVGFRSGG